jgi:putative toxin-antitoxin system antitoxin component (TIGR02293 family)
MNIKRFDTKESIKRADADRSGVANKKTMLEISGKRIVWKTKMDRIHIVREGLPIIVVESISQKADMPVIKILKYLGVPQTTYNKKKREEKKLGRADTDLIMGMAELLDFGLEVFNYENEKFQRWLIKPNAALGGVAPESLFDSLTGIQEVRNSLNRLEYGNLA